MQETGHPMRLTSEEVSWMVSLLYLGNILSPLPAGYLMDKFGRKTALMFLSVIPLSSWVMILFAYNPVMLYVARFFSGIWSGIVSTIAPMYLAEISEPRVRGALSTFVQLMTNLGVLTEYIIGPIISYEALACISKEAASKSLAWLRGQRSETGVADELTLMEHAVYEEMKNKGRFRDLIASKGNKRALVIVEALALLQRMSGISALMAYTSTTLPARGAGVLSPNDCVIVMGLVWVASVFIATFLVDSLGRRPLLLVSTCGCGLAMFLAGGWFFLDTHTDFDVSEFYWVPFGSFLLYGLCFCIGLGPIASTVQGEAFPTNIKGLASGVTSVVLAITSFIMNKVYHPIAEGVGMFLNYWIFAGSCLAATLFVVFYVIETKGKTLHEIQEELNKSKKRKEKNPAIV
ncbi:hypothetical protein AAG570_007697 [Ranatra chinensis]|uniref:Major facilitator superfamily (MFS) profile domain-containing protein n=1 Tax=Ranatra chinensis TaxID=642074 RepID=A0ABD0Y7I1_9HEMI